MALAAAVIAVLALAVGLRVPAYGATEGPYGGTPAAVPGTVQAANYDTGGSGTAYNVTSVNGSANSYRSDGVDLEACTDTGCGYDIGWTAAGQWFKYTVNVATAGTYTVSLRLASPYGITDALHIANSAGTSLSGPVAVPNTGGYQAWTTVTASVTLPAGGQTLTIDQDSNGWNIHQLTLALSSSGGGEAPYGGTPAAVPGTVQAANYDTGGSGTAYHVTAVNGTANSYRSDGVDLEVCADTGCGYDVGWTAAGQWFKYTVNVATAGTYALSMRLAAPTAVTDGLHVANSAGTSLTGPVTVPATGGYQAWTTVTASVTLPAGVQTLTVDQDNPGWNIHYLAFATGSSTGGSYGGFPSGFWGNTSAIPSAGSGAIEFDFLNATNGAYPDSEVYWSVNGVEESVAQSPYYTMTACGSCRIYFYLGSPNSQYYDFIELNSSGTTINADTSRVDAFRLPLAIHLHNSDGTDTVVGEDDQVFAESRTALFQQFQNAVPAAFQQLATVQAPYAIPAPSDVAAFQPGGADASYMTAYAASVGATETTQEVFGCAGGGSPALNGDPSLCAGLNRCVAQFSTTIQNTPADYYQNAPCNYYSAFWHSVAVNGLQYGFAYDDDNGQSSDFNTTDAQYVQVAIGF
jgi:hypothetical protein